MNEMNGEDDTPAKILYYLSKEVIRLDQNVKSARSDCASCKQRMNDSVMKLAVSNERNTVKTGVFGVLGIVLGALGMILLKYLK